MAVFIVYHSRLPGNKYFPCGPSTGTISSHETKEARAARVANWYGPAWFSPNERRGLGR
jgi:hypothetical protein